MNHRGLFESKYEFLVYYFNNIMDICFDELNWKPQERAKEMKPLIAIYKKSFRLYNYSDVQIWKSIKRGYCKDWDKIMYDNYNNTMYGEPV